MPIPIDGLLAGVVAVRDGHLRSGGDVELEDGDGGSRVLPSAGIRPGSESPTAPYLFISSSLRVCPLLLSR